MRLLYSYAAILFGIWRISTWTKFCPGEGRISNLNILGLWPEEFPDKMLGSIKSPLKT